MFGSMYFIISFVCTSIILQIAFECLIILIKLFIFGIVNMIVCLSNQADSRYSKGLF